MIERRRWMLDENGKPYEDLTINIGASEVNAELYDGKVWRIWIDSVGLHTHDGVSVGSNALSVLRRNPTISVEIGPGPSMVLIPKKPCGISYVVGIELPEDVPPVMTRRQAEVMLGESKIAKLIVVGCGEEVHSSI